MGPAYSATAAKLNPQQGRRWEQRSLSTALPRLHPTRQPPRLTVVEIRAILHSFMNRSLSISGSPSQTRLPHGLYSPWNSPGQNTGVGNHFLLQGIFPTQGSNPGLPHCRQILYQLSHKGNPRILEWVCIRRLPYTLILLLTIHSSLWATYAHICSICENICRSIEVRASWTE